MEAIICARGQRAAPTKKCKEEQIQEKKGEWTQNKTTENEVRHEKSIYCEENGGREWERKNRERRNDSSTLK